MLFVKFDIFHLFTCNRLLHDYIFNFILFFICTLSESLHPLP